MSEIFEALRRSEAERSGLALSESSEAPEMLLRAERNAASKWRGGNSGGGAERKQDHQQDSRFEEAAVPVGGIAIETVIEDQSNLSEAREALSVLGSSPSRRVAPPSQNRLVCLTDVDSRAAEAFRLLDVRLREIRGRRSLKKVLITSTIPQEGKSLIAANLACALARTQQQNILLIEGDLRRPALSQMFGIGNNPGFCEVMRGERSLITSVYHLDGPNFWIMTAGTAPENFFDVMQSERLVAMMDQLTAWFDWIIIDSPPMLPCADTSIWTNLADGVLLVARQGTTEKHQLKRGLKEIDPQKIIGAILNGSDDHLHSDYYYGPIAKSTQDHSRLKVAS